MSMFGDYNIYKTSIDEYSKWRSYKDIQEAKRQEYLRRNPDAIKDYDLQRAKILLSSVDMMDRAMSKKSDNVSVAFESATSLGLGYAAIGGATLGFLVSKLKGVKKIIDNFTQKYPKSKNIVSMGIASISGVLGVLAAYPVYNFLSKIESNIYRKRRFDTMEKDLHDPKIFAVLDSSQKEIFNKNIAEIQENKNKNSAVEILKKNAKNFKQVIKEALYYDKNQSEFRKQHERDISMFEKELTEKEIKNAKKDRELLVNLIKSINMTSQSYTERMKEITDNLVTLSFAFGSIFALGYERIAKALKMKSYSLPANMGIIMLVGSTFFANWAQKRASQVGKFKAKQDLMQNPEKLIYVSSKKTNSIEEKDVEIKKGHKTSSFQFLKEFFKNNKEYQKWKNSQGLTGKDISKAMENIELTPEQIQDGMRLQKNMFKTFYKVDTNTQNYSSDIEVASESIKYPITLTMGTLGSVLGMKHLVNLRNSIKPGNIFKHSAKYVGIITLFTIPSLLLNSYFARAQKMGARISDMITMKDLEDYRWFADYSESQSDEVIVGSE